jgi:hypothetical protein
MRVHSFREIYIYPQVAVLLEPPRIIIKVNFDNTGENPRVYKFYILAQYHPKVQNIQSTYTIVQVARHANSF